MRRDMRADLMKRRLRKIIKSKYIKILLLVGVCICYASWNGSISQEKPLLDLKYVVVHLDLKKTPLKLDYLHGLLKRLKGYGANGLLMEYEDMFPFEGKLVNLSAPNCYKKDALKKFLYAAKKMGFEIIPLVQTFGHMENVLNLKQFSHLRENPNYTDSICPSKAEGRSLIKAILKQVIKFHKRIFPLKYIHIGCDEVYHIASCDDCINRNTTIQQIYLNHVASVHSMVKGLSKSTKVLLWDDMLRTISPAKWRYDYHVPVEPVYWMYEPYFNLRHSSLMNYHRTFPNIWIATAFKGADGSTSMLPNIRNRYYNHYTWMNIIKNYKFGGEKHTFSFKGIILTGWSRYNYNKPVCDLLPGSIPSLMVNLLLIQEFKSGQIDYHSMDPVNLFRKNIETKLKDSLACDYAEIEFNDKQTELELDRLYLESCKFEGSALYECLKTYLTLNYTVAKGVNATQSKNMFSIKDWCEFMIKSVKYLEYDLAEIMRDFYKENFITQYVFEKIFAIKMGLTACF